MLAAVSVQKGNTGTVYLLDVLFFFFCSGYWNVWISLGHKFTPIHLQLQEEPVDLNYLLKSDRKIASEVNLVPGDSMIK